MVWAKQAPCSECHSIGCHSRWCSIGQAKAKGMDAPPADRMVKAAPVRK